MDEKIFYTETIKPDLSDETLEHFGIKGMKWGIRKSLKNIKEKYRIKAKARKQGWGKVPKGSARGTGSAESLWRRSVGYQGPIYKFKEVSSLAPFNSAMYKDPRFESHTGAINTNKDKRFTRQGRGIDYDRDKRFTSRENGINVFYDKRYNAAQKRR